jgi:hypothetical protein
VIDLIGVLAMLLVIGRRTADKATEAPSTAA